MGISDFDRITPIVTYVLELEKNKFYVGSTYDFNRRLGEHLMGIYGSKFTRLYKPIRIVGVYKGNCERDKTLQFMHQKGYQNVRGAKWCNPLQIEMPPELEDYKASIRFKETLRYQKQKKKEEKNEHKGLDSTAKYGKFPAKKKLPTPGNNNRTDPGFKSKWPKLENSLS